MQVMDADEHDRALALTSHLPHLLSVRPGRHPAAGVVRSHRHRLPRYDPPRRRTTRLVVRHFPQPIQRISSPRSIASKSNCSTSAQALLQGDRAALEALLQQGKKVRDDLSRP